MHEGQSEHENNTTFYEKNKKQQHYNNIISNAMDGICIQHVYICYIQNFF